MRKEYFINWGQYVVLCRITEEGNILVADTISIKTNEWECGLRLIIREARKGTDTGGPF